jgi:hypothetical protein
MADERDDIREDAAFAQLFRALPRIDPGEAFVERVARAAWEQARRRRQTTRWARAAAALLLAGGALAIAVATVEHAGTWLIESSAGLAARATLAVATLMRLGATAWAFLERIGLGVRTALAVPEAILLVWALEAAGMAAFVGLLRVLRHGMNGEMRS